MPCPVLLTIGLKPVDMIPTHQQSQGPTTKGGQWRLLSIVGRTRSLSFFSVTLLGFPNLCFHFLKFILSSSAVFPTNFLVSLSFYYPFLSSLYVLPFLDLPLLLQFLLALCFLELKTHLLHQARLNIFWLQRGENAILSYGQGSFCQNLQHLWNDYCCRSVVSGPALDGLKQQEIIDLIHLTSQLTASNPIYLFSFYITVMLIRNLLTPVFV